uniref:Uncharacterized protein n=1 Tax=Cacopsylla melanoneura TaxID=428564 RepID=A0A8D8M3A2_9HEMI
MSGIGLVLINFGTGYPPRLYGRPTDRRIPVELFVLFVPFDRVEGLPFQVKAALQDGGISHFLEERNDDFLENQRGHFNHVEHEQDLNYGEYVHGSRETGNYTRVNLQLIKYWVNLQ